MDFQLLKRNWEAFGRDDPLWAVLTEPTRRGGLWDPDEFLATGELEVAELFSELHTFGIEVAEGRALDFGCGAGRLTQALAGRFDRCDGVDIAASMIGAAERLNRHGQRVAYHVNPAADLALFRGETFDFVLSYIVLQHMEPRYAKRYIAEFVRVLKVGAVAVFSLPTGLSAPVAPSADGVPSPSDAGPLDHMATSLENPDAPVMEMYGIAPNEVEAVLTAAGARIEQRIPDSRGGPGVEGYRYVVRRVNQHVPSLPRPSLAYLAEALAAVPERPDKFPPLITRRSGRVGRLELTARRQLARALRPFTWVQAEYDREALRALTETHEALREQDAELRRLESDMARLRGATDDRGSASEAVSAPPEGVTPEPEPPLLCWPLDHFYSPIADNRALLREPTRSRVFPSTPRAAPGIDWRGPEQVALLRALGALAPIEFPDDATEDLRDYHAANGMFSRLDAWVLQAMLRHFRPRHVIETGCGWSSLVTARINREFFDQTIDFTCIEPYPPEFLGAGIDGISKLIVSPVEEMELDPFRELGDGDVLFIDTSHVVKTGGDVVFLYQEVLPRLAPGVVVHIHDIFLPWDYPEEWVRAGRSWNEQYLVRAFLSFNSAFQILLGVGWMSYNEPAALTEAISGYPTRFPDGGGSLWLRRV